MEATKAKEAHDLEENLRDFIQNNISQSIRITSQHFPGQNNFLIPGLAESQDPTAFESIASRDAPADPSLDLRARKHPGPPSKEERPITVAVRIRPFMEREALKGKFISSVEPLEGQGIVSAYEYFNLEGVAPGDMEEFVNQSQHFNLHQFAFDRVFGLDAGQADVYEAVGRPVVRNVLEGFNGSILAYGQTGTGKTHTMEGFVLGGEGGRSEESPAEVERRRGIIPRTVETIFEEIASRKELEAASPRRETRFSVECSFMQLYNEQVEDLLTSKRKPLNIRENPQEGVFVEGLRKVPVSSSESLLQLVGKGFQRRVTASTALNDVSSRSHAVCRIVVDQQVLFRNQEGRTSREPSG